jgi:hypothetical protein
MKAVTMTLEQYEALTYYARYGRAPDTLRSINAFIQEIEKENGITRSFLWVQWQEADYALPPTARFPDRWPPELRFNIERSDRALARADVEKVLATKAKRPVTVMVTTDPGGELGWIAIDDYFKG